MSDALENKAVELLDKSGAALDKSGAALGQFADQLAALAKQYGPEVANAALTLARVDAAAPFLWAVPGALVGVYAAYRGLAVFKRGWAKERARDLIRDWDKKRELPDGDPEMFTGVFVGGAGFLATLICSFPIFDVWRWVGIFEPKLWLAKKILGL